MLNKIMQLDISTMLILQITTIIYHHMKKVFLKNIKKSNNNFNYSSSVESPISSKQFFKISLPVCRFAYIKGIKSH